MSAGVAGGDYQGKRILVVERELLVPFTLYRLLKELEAEVIGPVTFPEDVTLLLTDGHVDGAILDNRMPVADRKTVLRALRQRHVPFVEACGCRSCLSGLDGCYRLTKPKKTSSSLGARCSLGRSPAIARRVLTPGTLGFPHEQRSPRGAEQCRGPFDGPTLREK